MFNLNYPEHQPHGVEESVPNENRIWACDECGHIFADEEAKNIGEEWGHPCKHHPCSKGQRCESHLEPYLPDLGSIKLIKEVSHD